MMFFPLLVQAQDNQSINSISILFDSLKANPNTITDEIVLQKALKGKQLANSNLFPEIGLFGSYEHASTPVGLLPLAPNDLLKMVQDQTVPQPFSDDIYRVGATISMPVFIKSIYTTASRAKMLYQSAADKKYINLLKNEATLVSLNANLQYLQGLAQALDKKKQSLLTTREIITIKVDSDRSPRSALLIIDDGINQIDLMKNNIAIQQSEVRSMIQTLTGITLNLPVSMTQVGSYQEGILGSLDPLRKKIEADKLGLRAEKEKLLPSLLLRGNYSYSGANAYNNDLHLNEDFTTFGLVLRVPLFTKTQYTRIDLSKLDVQASENELAKLELELSSQATQLQENLNIINNNITLYTKSIKDKEDILDIAGVSYKTDRLTIQDYLQYEDDVVLEKSKLYKSEAERWQTLMKLAVIYGNNIEEIIK